jgi:hypothetical protein
LASVVRAQSLAGLGVAGAAALSDGAALDEAAGGDAPPPVGDGLALLVHAPIANNTAIAKTGNLRLLLIQSSSNVELPG